MDQASRRFFERQRVAHLATADATGVPHVVPICFALIGETVYIAIDEKPKAADVRRLKRLRNIAENPRVAIVADVYDDQNWSQLGFLLLHAHARVLPPSDPEHRHALLALREKYPQYRQMRLEDRPVIAAEIESVSAWGQLDG